MTSERPARVALLVDGENVSVDFAGKLIVGAVKEGTITIKRVYGHARRIPAWENAPGYRFVHSGEGKNAADLVLTIGALDIFHRALAEVFVIASSDGGFRHLATYLRENGARVVGAGEDKSPDGFRKACSHWLPLGGCSVEDRIAKCLKGHPQGVAMQRVNPLLKTIGISLAHVEQATWRAYFKAHPDQFSLTGDGQATRVRTL